MARGEGLGPEEAFDVVQEAFHSFLTLPAARTLVDARDDSRNLLVVVTRNLARNRPDITQEKLARLRELINSAIPDCLVTGYQSLIEGLKLPDPKDRHVLAAAIKAFTADPPARSG